jgi:hypothetical protein
VIDFEAVTICGVQLPGAEFGIAPGNLSEWKGSEQAGATG